MPRLTKLDEVLFPVAEHPVFVNITEKDGERHLAVPDKKAILIAIAINNLLLLQAITLNGVVGLHYRVEYRNSLNPADPWQSLQDIPVLSSSPLLIDDPAPFQSQRLYRAAKLP